MRYRALTNHWAIQVGAKSFTPKRGDEFEEPTGCKRLIELGAIEAIAEPEEAPKPKRRGRPKKQS